MYRVKSPVQDLNARPRCISQLILGVLNIQIFLKKVYSKSLLVKNSGVMNIDQVTTE